MELWADIAWLYYQYLSLGVYYGSLSVHTCTMWWKYDHCNVQVRSLLILPGQTNWHGKTKIITFTYWFEVFISISDCTETQWEPTAITALFGVLPPALLLPKYKADFVAFVTLPARRLILLRWKSPAIPPNSHYSRTIFFFIKLIQPVLL